MKKRVNSNPAFKNITNIWDAYQDIIKDKEGKHMARKATTKYDSYAEETQQFMLATEAFLKKRYGKIEKHWEAQLQLLATNYDLFIQCKKQVNKDGLMITNRFGGLEKHPMLKQMTDSQIQMVKLVHEFGLSPNALGKLKETEPDDSEDVIRDLING